MLAEVLVLSGTGIVQAKRSQSLRLYSSKSKCNAKGMVWNIPRVWTAGSIQPDFKIRKLTLIRDLVSECERGYDKPRLD